MERQVLDSLYEARPTSAFKRALSEARFDRGTYDFLAQHAEKLDVESLLALLPKPLGEGVERHDAIFVNRLADLLPSADDHFLLEALRLADAIDRNAWADLTRRIKGKLLPNWKWYRFVDRTKGGRIFTALNRGLTVHPDQPAYDPNCLVTSIEEGREEPLVVPLLDRPDNDLVATAYALTLPMNTILDLQEHLPDLMKLADVKAVAAGRAASKEDRWRPPLPMWMAPFVAQRLGHCDDDEALDLFKWVVTAAPTSINAFEVALDRYKKAPQTKEWQRTIGGHLTTGKAWKTLGRRVVQFCVELNLGFSQLLIDTALVGAKADSGADVEVHRKSIVGAMHDVTASVFVERAERAIAAEDWAAAKRLLSALTYLDPASFISGPVHHLGRSDVPDEVRKLINACERLFKRSGSRAPTVETFQEAFWVLMEEGAR